MVYAYLRQTSRSSSLSIQQQSIASCARSFDLEIDKEVLEYSNVLLKMQNRKKFESFIGNLKENDTVIVYDIFLLSCYMGEIIEIINCMLRHRVNLHIASMNTLINNESKIEQLLPMLTRDTNETKSKSNQLGRPKGSRSSSKFDSHRFKITSMLKDGMSVSAIARELKVQRSSLKDYINSRELREFAQEGWTDMIDEDNNKQKEGLEILLICPFENKKKETK